MGAKKLKPFTIVIVANPAVENPRDSGRFFIDPMPSSRARFNAAASYIDRCMFGALPGQAELFLGDPSIAPQVRVLSLFVTGLPAEDANALIALDDWDESDLIVARRQQIVDFLARFDLEADVVYAVTDNPTHTRATAYYTSDDDSLGGVSFTLDGAGLVHRWFCRIPGCIAIHATAHSLTALHELGHALSSYTNGGITDLYVDSAPDVNVRSGRPIPAHFAHYQGVAFASDASRDGLGYPATWSSYHCELHDPTLPAVMDDYTSALHPLGCQHDKITRLFLLDRVRAKLAR